MRKRLLSLLLAFVMVCSISVYADVYAEDDTDKIITLDDPFAKREAEDEALNLAEAEPEVGGETDAADGLKAAEFSDSRIIVKVADMPMTYSADVRGDFLGIEVKNTEMLSYIDSGAVYAADSSATPVSGGAIMLLELTESGEDKVLSAIETLRQNPAVAYAEPDYIVHTDAVPNDPMYSMMKDMERISAPEAWDTATGSKDVVVGIIDTGIDYNHEDLADNIWTNPGEIPDNGIDDDGNGYIDDVHGWDFANDDNDPMDDHFHGTHVASTVGASGNNGVGITGINHEISLMAIKVLDEGGSGFNSDIIQGIEYAGMMGADITNNSYGGGSYSQAERDVIAKYSD